VHADLHLLADVSDAHFIDRKITVFVQLGGLVMEGSICDLFLGSLNYVFSCERERFLLLFIALGSLPCLLAPEKFLDVALLASRGFLEVLALVVSSGEVFFFF